MFGKTLNLTVLFSLLAATGQAFTLKPMSATLDPQGYRAAQTFRVENESPNRIAYQISIVSREVDAAGKETLLPATNLFTLFPPQGVIGPNKSQSVRLLWKGPANPTNELSYRIVAEELPVDFTPEKGKAQIKILLRYQGTVYVRPKGAKPAIRLEGLTKTPTNLWQLAICNTGNAHQNLLNPRLALTDASGQKFQFTTNQLQSIDGENVLPGHTRHFLISLPADLKEPVAQTRFDVDE